MILDLCLDDESFRLNDDGNMELFFDEEFFEISDSGGLAFKNTLGYMRPFTPKLLSDHVEVTNPNGTVKGLFSRVRCSGNMTAHATADALDYYLTRFAFYYSLGSGFSIPNGTLGWSSSFTSNSGSGYVIGGVGPRDGAYSYPTGLVGRVHYVQSGSSNIGIPYLFWYDPIEETYGMKGFTGSSITHSTHSYAEDDVFIGSGYCFAPVLRTDPIV